MGILETIGGGCFGLLWLAFTIFAIVQVASARASALIKVLWVAVILVFPCGGPVLWLVLGPRTDRY